MAEHALRRRHPGRRIACTPEALEACREYIAERVSLLQRAVDLFENAFQLTRERGVVRWSRQTLKELKYAERLEALLADTVAA
jgi:hypothetical protein